MGINPISKQSEELLIDALGSVADLVLDGMSPNDAIAKEASERKVPRGHIGLMVTAYNAGRTENQRKSGTSVLEKAAEFELADTDKVLAMMYPSSIKTAAQTRVDTAVDSSYSRPPHFLQDRERFRRLSDGEKFLQEKTAQEAPKPARADLGQASKKALAERDRGRRMVNQARAKAQDLFDQTGQEISKLASLLRTHGAPNFHAVKDNSVILFGKKAAELFDWISERHRTLATQANVSDPLVAVSVDKAPYSNVQAILKLADEFYQARA